MKAKGDLPQNVMTTAEMAEVVLKKMIESVNSDKEVRLERDFGGNTVTVHVGSSHTHCGVPDGTWELLVLGLYNSLHGGPGLSWHKEKADDGSGA